jgi:hypothetical protein
MYSRKMSSTLVTPSTRLANRLGWVVLLLPALNACSPPASPPALPPGKGSRPDDKTSRVKELVSRASAQSRICYKQALTQDPLQQGRLFFFLNVDGTGTVSKVSISPSESLSASMIECVRLSLQSLVFEPPEGGNATVSGSFIFKLGKPQAPLSTIANARGQNGRAGASQSSGRLGRSTHRCW